MPQKLKRKNLLKWLQNSRRRNDMKTQTCPLKTLKTLELVMLARATDDKMTKLVRQNKGGNFHLCANGHELVGVVLAQSLKPGKDWGLPYYRDRPFAIGLGCELDQLFGSFLAREVAHHSGGRMMPEHFSHKALRIPCQSSCVGSQFLQAVGVAKSIQLLNRNEVVYVSGGDGSTSQGDFHEALNFACIHKLPVIFVIQDNGWAISVPSHEQTAGGTIVKMARGYEGLSVFDVDGTSYEALSEAALTAVTKGREGQGPSLIVAKVPRIGAHSSSDDPGKYQTEEQKQACLAQDPLIKFKQYCLDQGFIDKSALIALEQKVFDRVEQAAVAGENYPEPAIETALDHVFKDFEVEDKIIPADDSQEAVVIVDALNHALDEAMENDPYIVVFGQDVAHGKGGVFGVTRFLTERYGQNRCFNSPLAESSIVGIAIGMSMVEPIRPVVEIQFADYVWTGINQLINELSSLHYRSRGEWNCPIVIRMPCGGYIQGGPYHSQNIEAHFAHVPGLKVVLPSNAEDAKRLLKASILDLNPVVFLEHKGLYRQRAFCARKEPLPVEIESLGKAKIVREGTDLTLISWGMTTVMGNQVVDQLEKEGISVELIDLRTIVPYDHATVETSVKKTGKVLIVHEACKNAGFGAEIAAQISEKLFNYLDAPIMRIAAKDAPVPYNLALEKEILPSVDEIKEAALKLAHY
jgi:2-oxoisovalerate dehydrogenase E1 component